MMTANPQAGTQQHTRTAGKMSAIQGRASSPSKGTKPKLMTCWIQEEDDSGDVFQPMLLMKDDPM